MATGGQTKSCAELGQAADDNRLHCWNIQQHPSWCAFHISLPGCLCVCCLTCMVCSYPEALCTHASKAQKLFMGGVLAQNSSGLACCKDYFVSFRGRLILIEDGNGHGLAFVLVCRAGGGAAAINVHQQPGGCSHDEELSALHVCGPAGAHCQHGNRRHPPSRCPAMLPTSKSSIALDTFQASVATVLSSAWLALKRVDELFKDLLGFHQTEQMSRWVSLPGFCF